MMETYIKILQKQVLLMDIELTAYKMAKKEGKTTMPFEEYSALMMSRGYLGKSLKLMEKANKAVKMPQSLQ
jgi:hypothetical protein